MIDAVVGVLLIAFGIRCFAWTWDRVERLHLPGRVRIRLGVFGLDFDRDYGLDRRRGWSVVIDGVVVDQFVSLPSALWTLGLVVLGLL